MQPWEPEHEVVERRLVPVGGSVDAITMLAGFEPFYYRALFEADLTGE